MNLELPDFPEQEQRTIRVMFGIEERAKKFPNSNWQIKTSPCNACGKCCMKVPDNWKFGKNPETGACAHLIYSEGHDNGETMLGWLCDFGTARPFSCSTGVEFGKDYCSVKWVTEDCQ